MLLRVTVFASLLFLVCCKNNGTKSLDRLDIPEDSLIIQEFIGGITDGRMDTISLIRIDLKTFQQEVFVNPKVDLGVRSGFNIDKDSIAGIGILYTNLEKGKKFKEFQTKQEGGGISAFNFDPEHRGNGASSDYGSRMYINKGKHVFITQPYTDKDRLERITKFIHDVTDYDEIVMYSVVSDQSKRSELKCSY